MPRSRCWREGTYGDLSFFPFGSVSPQCFQMGWLLKHHCPLTHNEVAGDSSTDGGGRPSCASEPGAGKGEQLKGKLVIGREIPGSHRMQATRLCSGLGGPLTRSEGERSQEIRRFRLLDFPEEGPVDARCSGSEPSLPSGSRVGRTSTFWFPGWVQHLAAEVFIFKLSVHVPWLWSYMTPKRVT